MTVLIIESSLLIGGRIRNLLIESGKVTHVTQSVEHKKAVAVFESIKPEVVLLDMCLPGTVPIELLRQIKEDRGAATSIVAMVNCEDDQKKLKCTSIGADYILDKYHEFEAIPEIIEQIVRKQYPGSTNEKPQHNTALA